MTDMNSMTTFWIILVVALIIFAAMGIKQVPQSKVRLVERLGKYHKTLNSGINFIIPFLDRIHPKEIDVSEQQLSIPDQNVTSSDNVRIILELQAFYRITEPAHFTYRIEDGVRAVKTTIDATVRALVGRRTLDQLNAERLQLASEVAQEVRATSSEWGVSMNRVEITDVQILDQEFADSMRLQAQAERQRRGTVIDAEAQAQAVRIEADALFYKAQKEAEAIRVTAEAQAWALSAKGVALDGEGARVAQQGEILQAQVKALESLGGSTNSKLIVIPSDLVQAAGALGNLIKK